MDIEIYQISITATGRKMKKYVNGISQTFLRMLLISCIVELSTFAITFLSAQEHLEWRYELTINK